MFIYTTAEPCLMDTLSTADAHNITDKTESPDSFFTDFNILESPE